MIDALTSRLLVLVLLMFAGAASARPGGDGVPAPAVIRDSATPRPSLSATSFPGLGTFLPAPITSNELGDTQPVNPATRTGEQPADSGKSRLRTYELPAINVEGVTASPLREEDLVGPYQQPRWTTGRRFPNTRVYVIPEGKVETEYWNRSTWDRDHNVEVRNLAELEVGLPNHFQLDVYFRTDQDDYKDHVDFGQQIELRWALADWGKIWGNPTLYFEYIVLDNDRPDRIEPKLLLGGEIAQGWHWGANFVTEQEIDGPQRIREYEFTGGVSYTVFDSKLDIGAETKLNIADQNGSRGHFVGEYYLGPSIQWKPLPQWTINFAPLIGLTGDSPYAQVTFNMAWEF